MSGYGARLNLLDNTQLSNDSFVRAFTSGGTLTDIIGIDSSDDLSINAPSGGTIELGIGGTQYVRLFTGRFQPFADATYDLGHPGARWADFFISGDAEIGGNIVVDGDFNLLADTTDGSDSYKVAIASGGANSSDRGAAVLAHGNEHATAPGELWLQPGDTGDIKVQGVTDYTATMGNSTKDPTADAPSDWVEIKIGGSSFYLPAYTA